MSLTPSIRRRLAVAALSTGVIAVAGASVADAAPNHATPHAPSHVSTHTVRAGHLRDVRTQAHKPAPRDNHKPAPRDLHRPAAHRPAPRAVHPAPRDLHRAAPRVADHSPQAVAHQIVPASQYASFNQIVSHESGWNVHATNPSSGAYGLGQALPASKMSSAGGNWHDDPATQIRWTYHYMNSRYGSPNAAWAFWQQHHWY